MLFSFFGIAGVLIVTGAILSILGVGHLKVTLPVEHKASYQFFEGVSYPSALHVQGNQLVNAEGEIIRLRGIMIPDPYHLNEEGQFKQELITEIKNAGANVIRIPVHPEFWQQDKDYLWRYLDPLVTWAGNAGMYVIIDLHFIGNIATGEGDQMPNLEIPASEFTDRFWITVAPYFSKAPHVLFEIFNEPADITVNEWISSSSHLINLIRSEEINQPLIIGGVEYSKDLSWVLTSPLQDDNLIYSSHIYPSHPINQWDHWFGEISSQYPVMITEWGFLDASTIQGPQYLAGSRQGYGDPLISYMDSHGIGWVACWYDDEWLPPMFSEGRESMTEYGLWIFDKLKP